MPPTEWASEENDVGVCGVSVSMSMSGREQADLAEW